MATEWVRWTPERAESEPALAAAVERFKPLEVPAGRAASAFLREDSLSNDGSTRTHLCVCDDRVAGFIALCATQVALARRDARSLGIPHRQLLPACLLAWIARDQAGDVTGRELMTAAYGLARLAAAHVGMAAFVLDPMDDAIARIWRAPPYEFRESKDSRRLWLPLD